MANWELTTEYKKSSIERQFWYKDDKVIIREEGYRWSTFTIESDEMPLTFEELRNEDNCYELDWVESADASWEMEDMIDGCWAESEAGRNCTDEDLEEFDEAREENYYEGVEELGWSHDDTEYFMQGPLKLTNLDTGEEFKGSDLSNVVRTIELPTETVETESANWAFPTERPQEGPQAKWPFDDTQKTE